MNGQEAETGEPMSVAEETTSSSTPSVGGTKRDRKVTD